MASFLPPSAVVRPSPPGAEQLSPLVDPFDPALALLHGSRLAPAYTPRRPHDTLLYRIVHDYLEEFIELAEECYERPLPRYVIKAFRAYLKCGRFEEGFIRLRCDCGQERLLALSCKQRASAPRARHGAWQSKQLIWSTGSCQTHLFGSGS